MDKIQYIKDLIEKDKISLKEKYLRDISENKNLLNNENYSFNDSPYIGSNYLHLTREIKRFNENSKTSICFLLYPSTLEKIVKKFKWKLKERRMFSEIENTNTYTLYGYESGPVSGIDIPKTILSLTEYDLMTESTSSIATVNTDFYLSPDHLIQLDNGMIILKLKKYRKIKLKEKLLFLYFNKYLYNKINYLLKTKIKNEKLQTIIFSFGAIIFTIIVGFLTGMFKKTINVSGTTLQITISVSKNILSTILFLYIICRSIIGYLIFSTSFINYCIYKENKNSLKNILSTIKNKSFKHFN